ncbi:MAG: HTH domain-containing protein [Paludibacteraceae bacterium]|nr:HTH domain-containing protein [Paludibacteraceae bacterium]
MTAKHNVIESSASLAEKFHVNERTFRRDLVVLQKNGYLLHAGPAKGGRWQIL